MCLPLLAAIPAAIGAAGSTAAGAVGSIGLGTMASLAGSGLSAYGAIQQGNAQKAAADAQAAAYDRQALMATQQGNYQAGRKQDEIDGTIGTRIASVAGSGVNLAGSPTDGIASVASSGALDTSAILYSAKVQANNLSYQARLARQSGKSAQQAGMINMVGGLVRGFEPDGPFTRLGKSIFQ